MSKKYLCICVLLLATSALNASSPREYQKGRLLELTHDEEILQGTSVKHAVFRVQIADVIYIARGARMGPKSGDPAHGLVVGDNV
jgi:hypothetical protein